MWLIKLQCIRIDKWRKTIRWRYLLLKLVNTIIINNMSYTFGAYFNSISPDGY